MFLENILDPAFVEAFYRAILHSLWQGSVIALLLFVTLKFVPEGNAGVRYEIAALALFSVLILGICTFVLNLDQGNIDSSPGDPVISQEIRNTRYGIFSSELLSNPAYLGFYLWVSGLLLFSLRFFYGLRKTWSIQRSGNLLGFKEQQVLARMKKQLHIKQRVILVSSEKVHSPQTIGFWKPVILFPISSYFCLTPAQFEMVLAHELAHIRRSDFLMNMFFYLIEILFYYHPAVWWISTQIKHEREANCDDLAIELTGNKKFYLETLFHLQKTQHQNLLAMGLAGKNHSSFYRRISRHFNSSPHKLITMEKISVILFLLLAFTGLSFKTHSPVYEVTPPEKWTEPIIVSMVQDTQPPKQRQTIRIKTNYQGKRYDFLQENGEIIHIKRDGKKIDPAEYHEYTAILEHLQYVTPPLPPEPPLPDIPPIPGFPGDRIAPLAPLAPLPPLPPIPPYSDLVPVPPVPPVADFEKEEWNAWREVEQAARVRELAEKEIREATAAWEETERMALNHELEALQELRFERELNLEYQWDKELLQQEQDLKILEQIDWFEDEHTPSARALAEMKKQKTEMDKHRKIIQREIKMAKKMEVYPREE